MLADPLGGCVLVVADPRLLVALPLPHGPPDRFCMGSCGPWVPALAHHCSPQGWPGARSPFFQLLLLPHADSVEMEAPGGGGRAKPRAALEGKAQ